MTKVQKITIVGSLVVAVLLVIGAGAIAIKQKQNAEASLSVAQHNVTHAQLAKADGRNGRICYAAVSGEVYLIQNFSLWQDGKHTPSGGLAYCGADLTSVIDKSPHGRRILNILPKVGPLVP